MKKKITIEIDCWEYDVIRRALRRYGENQADLWVRAAGEGAPPRAVSRDRQVCVAETALDAVTAHHDVFRRALVGAPANADKNDKYKWDGVRFREGAVNDGES